ncbi:MAG TPA: glycosyl hydrolase [Phycisphaerae bacterium]|nr:glycosyl hydrolase [Phycisphaerae bacterium]HRY66915.1 glycosyl hydrolase [Phycisphaerae bacterium]HSA27863.1 glycosyl hydrolase [Phycisphaerae bacterium]
MMTLGRFLAVCSLTSSLAVVAAAAAEPDLEQAFRAPPAAARPWVFWWWLNSNVSREGITRDLEAMKRQGIQGVLIFNAGEGATPRGPRFLGPEWLELYRFTLQEASRLGMEVSVNLCDGWDAGGPWIPPEAANKKLVWSECQVDGPRGAPLSPPHPATVDGFYREVAVVAIRERPTWPVQPASIRASSSAGGYCDEWNWPPEDAADGDRNTSWQAAVAPAPGRPAWIEYTYSEPLLASAVFVCGDRSDGPRECELQTSEDGKAYKTILSFEQRAGFPQQLEFTETASKVFRLLVKSSPTRNLRVAEMWLLRQGDEPSLGRGIKWWWFKSGNRSFWDWPREGPAVMEEEYPDDGTRDCLSSEVVDLTSRLGQNGHLQWEVPMGRWSILRFGYTLEGQRTRCSSTVIGYEADMLDAKGIETHFKHCATPLLEAAGDQAGKTLKRLHIDSYELGADVRGQQPTWSASFREEFRTRRGYDLTPFLPALARRIVDGREKTNRFLWDVRMTIADLMAERFFGRFAELAHARGVGIQCETGYGTYPHPQFDGLRVAAQCDVTMGEFWWGTDIMSQFEPFCNVIRSVASPAHVYGRRIVQAESFTSWQHFSEYPATLKPLGDRAFCDGLNRMVFHQYTHQPNEDRPGYQYGAGTHIDRHVTWWEMAAPWLNYLTRCQHLLQSGRFHADVAYFYGEGSAKYVPGKKYLKPALPDGYNYDCVNADVLLNRMKVADGRLALPEGVSYRLLVLPTQRTLSPGLLRKIRELIELGATVLGDRPARPPGLSDWPKCDQELKILADEMWGTAPGDRGRRQIGKGRLVWGEKPVDVLASIGTLQDFEVAGDNEGFEFIHRVIGKADVYFVSSQINAPQRVECRFRVHERQPELWDPVQGCLGDLPEQIQTEDDRTQLSLRFEPYQSFFVVFRKPLARAPQDVAKHSFVSAKREIELAGPWTVGFDPAWGGPEKAVFEKLEDWTQRPEEGIKHYSGMATYRKTLDLPRAADQGETRRFLDLGTVNYLARVRLNGKDLGVVWTAPWRVEITGTVKTTGNELEIEVVNTWVNRIVGDASLPADKRFCKTNVSHPAEHPLMPSGLLGPVTVRMEGNLADAEYSLACGRPTTVSSSIEAGNWTQGRLADGEFHSGWSSQRGAAFADHNAEPEYAAVKLRRPTAVDRVVLHPRDDAPYAGLGFPEDFAIRLSDDGTDWKTVIEKKGYPAPKDATPQVFTLNGVVARHVRVEATKLRAVEGLYFFQLAELEVFGKEQ